MQITRNCKVTLEEDEAITTYYINDSDEVHSLLKELTEADNNPFSQPINGIQISIVSSPVDDLTDKDTLTRTKQSAIESITEFLTENLEENFGHTLILGTKTN